MSTYVLTMRISLMISIRMFPAYFMFCPCYDSWVVGSGSAVGALDECVRYLKEVSE